MIDILRHDLRYALRGLRQRPGFTALTVLTLALGIGATSAIFSVVNGVLLRPLPYDRPEDVVMVHTRLEGNPRSELSQPEYWDVREQARTFTRLAAFSNGSLTLTGSGTPERLEAGFVTADAIPLLGVSPARGRAFAVEEDLPGRGLLFGVAPTDPAIFAATPLILAGVAVLASCLPARRATGVDPMTALRSE